MKSNELLNKAKLVLLGAICGDIIGSSYEFCPVKVLKFPIVTRFSHPTDDSVCSVAIADSFVSGTSLTKSLQTWCRKYPHAGYGGHFSRWIMLKEPHPYNSWGNGSAMRVSPVGAIAGNLDEAMTLAKKTAEITHNHPEGIKGAQATATAIFFALRGMLKEEIKSFIEKGFDYDLSRQYYDIQPDYSFDVSCQGSVPEAMICFLTATDYESTVRHAVAMGGDADTMGAIAGGIAAAYYGEIPQHILKECEQRIPEDMKEVIKKFNEKLESIYGE